MSFSIKFNDGIDKALLHAKILKALFTEFRFKVIALAEQALNKIRSQAPKKTGFMVRMMSIQKGGTGSVLFTINLKARYTGFVAFGHRAARSGRFIPGRDFVTPNYLWLIREMGKILRTAGATA